MEASKIPWKPFPHDDPSKVCNGEILVRVVVEGKADWYEAVIVLRETSDDGYYQDPPNGWFALVDGPSIPISNITHYCIPSTEVDDE